MATSALPVNPFDENHLLGSVLRVDPSSVVVSMGSIKNGPVTNRKPGPGQVGDFVIVECNRFGIFGRISSIRLTDTVESDDIRTVRQGVVQLLTTFDITSGHIHQGVLSQPQLGSQVYLADPKLVKLLAEAQQRGARKGQPLVLSFAQLPDAENTPVSFTPEMLFGRHCALVGSTGSGKSWSIARILEDIARHKSKAVLFDATGEFAPLSKATRHVYLGNDPHPQANAKEVSLPYFQLTESDLFAIFRPTGQSQAPKLRAAMKSLKLAILEPSLTFDGTIIKADKAKQQYEQNYARFYADIESPLARFDIRHLPRQIENECVKPTRSAMEPMYWGDYLGGEISMCIPLIARIQDIINSEELSPVFNPHGKPSLLDELDAFLQDDSVRILCVSLQYLSFAYNTREIIANAIGRHLLDLGRKGKFAKQPLVVFLDEAHQFLNKTVGDDQNYPLDSFALIAKEGRKFSLNICIATQRARDIPEGVLSQFGTMIVHRLINDQDRRVVERAASEMDQSSMATIPSLAPGEAVLIGVDFPVPLVIRVEAPSARPYSYGPDYQQCWK